MVTGGFIGRIPVRNIWVLMAYASAPEVVGSKVRVALEANPDKIVDIVADLLIRATSFRIEEGLTADYKHRRAVVGRVRGKINVLETEAHQLLRSGRISCSFHELTVNNDLNQYVLSAMTKASNLAASRDTARSARSLARLMRLKGVKDAATSEIWKPAYGFGLHRRDQEVVSLAQIIHQMALPSEDAGVNPVPDAKKEEQWVRRLFEKAMAGFFAHELEPKHCRVRTGTRIQWPLVSSTRGLSEILPTMQTDIVIDRVNPPARLVIDTKFNEITTNGWHRESTLRSNYLYQIYTYLRTQEDSEPSALNQKSSGLLLHPSIGCSVREQCVIQGHLITFATVDLAGKTLAISEELREIYQLANQAGSDIIHASGETRPVGAR